MRLQDDIHSSALRSCWVVCMPNQLVAEMNREEDSTYAVRSGGPSPQRLRGLGVTSDRLELETALDVTLRF
jgi:hypothetical protein